MKIDEKSGDTVVAEVITSKHPEAKTPDASSLDKYNATPDFVVEISSMLTLPKKSVYLINRV